MKRKTLGFTLLLLEIGEDLYNGFFYKYICGNY